MNFIFRMFLTFNATSLLIVVFLVKERVLLSEIIPRIADLPDFTSYILYSCLPLLLTYLSIMLSNLLPKDSIQSNNNPVIQEVEQANNAYLPSYLGYFFVALSTPYFDTLVFVYLILFIFTFMSQTLYFNPLFLLFGYQFYYVTTVNNVKVFIITKKTLKDPYNIQFNDLRRINDFTFIDRKVEKK